MKYRKNDANRYGFLARQQYRALRDQYMADARVRPLMRPEAVRKARWLNHLIIANLRG